MGGETSVKGDLWQKDSARVKGKASRMEVGPAMMYGLEMLALIRGGKVEDAKISYTIRIEYIRETA